MFNMMSYQDATANMAMLTSKIISSQHAFSPRLVFIAGSILSCLSISLIARMIFAPLKMWCILPIRILGATLNSFHYALAFPFILPRNLGGVTAFSSLFLGGIKAFCAAIQDIPRGGCSKCFTAMGACDNVRRVLTATGTIYTPSVSDFMRGCIENLATPFALSCYSLLLIFAAKNITATARASRAPSVFDAVGADMINFAAYWAFFFNHGVFLTGPTHIELWEGCKANFSLGHDSQLSHTFNYTMNVILQRLKDIGLEPRLVQSVESDT